VCYQIGSENDINLSAQLLLLGEILHEQCYDQLRTKQQLGYIVWSGSRNYYGLQGYRVTVQSSVKDPIILDERIEDFLEESCKRLTVMAEEEFQKFVAAKIISYLEKEHTLKELHDQFWDEVYDWKYRFNRYELLAERTRSLTLQEIQSFFNKYVQNSKTRRKISSRVFGNKHILKIDPDSETSVNIQDLVTFKNSMPLFPAC